MKIAQFRLKKELIVICASFCVEGQHENTSHSLKNGGSTSVQSQEIN